MHDARDVGRNYPVKLSILQRRLIAGLAPEFADRLKLSEQNQRVIPFDAPEWTTITRKVELALRPNAYDMRSRALRQALESIKNVIEEGSAQRLYPAHTTTLSIQDHATRSPAASLAANPGEELHAR